jgi:hypothetical protein
MLKKILGIVFLVSGVWGLVASASAQTESITFTTYYPSPYGVYKNLRIYPNDDNTPGDPCAGKEGEMYFDRSDQALCICSGSPPTWVPIGGTGGGSLWTQAGNNLYPNNNAWEVGIGMTNPAVELHVKNIGAIPVADIAMEPASSRLWTMSVTDAGIWELHYLLAGTSHSGVNSYVPVRVYAEGGGQANTLVVRGGNVGIGITSPTQKLDVNGKVKVNDSVIYPPRAGSPPPGIDPTASTGEVAYYATPNEFYYYDGSTWAPQAGGGGGGCYTLYGGIICAPGYTAVVSGFSTFYFRYAAGGVVCAPAKADVPVGGLGTEAMLAIRRNNWLTNIQNEPCRICCK